MKEKLLARNNSVKELSQGVQREMSAGIAGVARMIERFDLSSKRAGVSPPDSSHNGVGSISNLSTKGKGVLENIIVQSLSKNSRKVADDVNSDAASHPSIVIQGRVEVSRSKGSTFLYLFIFVSKQVKNISVNNAMYIFYILKANKTQKTLSSQH